MIARTGPHALSISRREPAGRLRFSLSTERLITRQVTSMSRTCSTSMSQRDVIHAQGHAGSNHIDTTCVPGAPPVFLVAAFVVLAAEVRLPVRVAVAVMMGILS